MILGFDGEGIGRNPHKYTHLCASDKTGFWNRSVHNPDGLTSGTCLAFLSDLAYENPKAVGFSFAFGYDITKIIQDLPDSVIYRLMRPDERKIVTRRGLEEPAEITWQDFRLNYFGTKFCVRRGLRNGERSNEKGLVIWDVFKFFQTAFVKSLETWKVGQNDLEFIEGMKAARGNFDQVDHEKIEKYCLLECKNLAELVEKLIDAHEKAGLELKSFYGAGSTAGALLDTMNIKGLIKKEIQYSKELCGSVPMSLAVKCAFFGGRFENSVIGPIKQDIYSYDISSAYPYQITFLPCLVHGFWRYTLDRTALDSANQALVLWLGSQENNTLWGGLPFRHVAGTIVFPQTGGLGFTYKQEFLQAERLFGVKFGAAWVLEQDCDCQPFKDIPYYYNERCRIGKDGPGIVLKLGVNAGYGKLAQSVGNPQYNSWLWAGMVTSGCRAQILEAAGCHANTDNLLSIATDGIYSLEKLELPKPIDTGTNDYGKPLGGWECKIVKGGMFFARPGVNFELENPSDVSGLRARGYGRKTIAEHYGLILDAYNAGEERVIFPNVVRFRGAKNCISRSEGEFQYEYKRSSTYGEWVEEPMRLEFSPMPKRAARYGNRLTPHQIPFNVLSSPYNKATAEETDGLDFHENMLLKV